MNERPDRRGGCGAVADGLSALALGIADGHERERVLGHVESCAACRAELDGLAVVAENLQQLVPDVEPPLGFETRVIERWRVERVERFEQRRPWRVTWFTAAAAALLVVVVVDVAWHVFHTAPPSSAAAPMTAHLFADGQSVGSVVVAPGNPSWLTMTVQGGQWTGTVSCEVTLADGTVATVGTFVLSGAYPSWTAQLPSEGGPPVSARLVDAHGVVLASAVLGA